MTTRIWAETALTSVGWADSVEIEIDARGDIAAVSPGQPYRDGDRVGILLPAIANVHSHAHQRAMAGLGEHLGQGDTGSNDSFWSWRQAMYHYVERLQPDDLYHVAAQLYLELLRAGYCCVGEFQYLHHGVDGQPYADRAEMSLQCLQAARDVGIGFTALPVLYRYGGFGGASPLDGQKRFLNDADGFFEIVTRLQKACDGDPNCRVGIAPHSLRAVDRELLRETIDSLDNLAAIHIHIAEQIREVDECVAWSGARPVQWLLDNFEVDNGWCLVHATHLDDDETERMAQSGCIAGLCPSTEANLGDGFFNLGDYTGSGGNWAIGSDSHISVDPVEELRWLEYGWRLQTRQRNLVATPSRPHSGRNLFESAAAGGARACGRNSGSIAVGRRADLLTLEQNHPRLYGRRDDLVLDSWIFSGNDNLVEHVYLGGKKIIHHGEHPKQAEIAANFCATLDRLAARRT